MVLREDTEIEPAACPLDCERQEGSSEAYTIFYPGLAAPLPACPLFKTKMSARWIPSLYR